MDLISAGVGALGGGKLLDLSNQWATNLFNMNQADVAWQRSMGASSTAYQRAMSDMRQAGLNPMLAFSRGGASSPGASAAQDAPIQGGTGDLVLSAMRLKNIDEKRLDNETKLANAQTANVNADTQQKHAARELAEQHAFESGARRALAESETVTSGWTAKKLQAELPYMEAKAEAWQALRPFIKEIIEAGRKLIGQGRSLEVGDVLTGLGQELTEPARKALRALVEKVDPRNAARAVTGIVKESVRPPSMPQYPSPGPLRRKAGPGY